jgi:hypothetical protein
MKIDDHLFHALWTKAVGTATYDKEQWNDLSNQINRANIEMNPKPKEYSTFGERSDEQIIFDAKHGTSYGMK